MLEFILIGFLQERSMSGYDLKTQINQTIGFFYSASFGSLYPALKRLEEKGWVTSISVEGDSKNKKLYTPEQAGKEAFLYWLSQPLQGITPEDKVRIFFMDYLDEERRLQLLRNLEFTVENEKRRLMEVEKITAQELASVPNPGDYYYQISLLKYGVQRFEMELNWLRTIVEKS